MSTHIAVSTTAKGAIDEIHVNTPRPSAEQVLVRVKYASLMAFDVYVVDSGFFVQNYPQILGFNVSGNVVEVGPEVTDLTVGDSVTGFALGSKATQEYAVLGTNECSKVPLGMSLESAATIPDNCVCAFYVLFDRLRLPIPTELPAATPPPDADRPILIYGSGTSAGQYCIQLLKLAGYKQIITAASPKHNDALRAYGATHVVDYNSPTFADDVIKVAGGRVPLALDCVSAEGTLALISKVISPDGTVAVLLPIKEGSAVTGAPGSQLLTSIPEARNPFQKSVNVIYVSTFTYQANTYLRDNLFRKILPPLLASREIKPNQVKLMDEGSFKDRVAAGLDLLRYNKVSGEKVIVKVPA